MSMEVIGVKDVNISKYTLTNDSKKADNKNVDIKSTTKDQGITKELGTDTYVKSTEEETSLTYKPVKKKLSAEEVQALKDEQQNLKIDLIKRFISDTIDNQNKLLGKSTDGISEMPKETTDLLISIFGSVEKAYPPIETTPEGAKKALEEGGAYSVNAMADRTMTMAKALAGDDPQKLQQMREAVEKGFSEAGLDFKKATNSELPQICKDTYDEIMKRFDELQSKTSSTEKEQPSTTTNV